MGIKDTPQFEDEDDVAAESRAEERAETPAPHQSTAVSTNTLKFQPALADKKDVFPTEAVVGLSMNTPRIKAEQGEAYVEQSSLGKRFRIQIESWNTRHLVSAGLGPNDPGYKESTEHLRNSYDGETIHGEGTSVADYLEHLKGMGFNKAKASSYLDVWGLVTWTEKEGDIPPEKQQLYLVQASQTSAGAFTAFCITQGLKRSRGVDAGDMSEVEVHAEPRSKGTLKFTNWSWHLPSK